MYSRSLAVLCLPLLAASSLAGQQADDGLTVRDRAILSRMAARILIETQQAREAIAREDRQTALLNVENAINQVMNIEQTAGGQIGRVVPLFAELEQVSIVRPIEAARRQTTGTAARRTPEDSHDSEPALEESDTEYTSIALDLDMARPHLETARAALRVEALDKADAALAAVQQGVILVTVESEVPLAKARQHLVQAKRMMEQQRFESAAAALNEAERALEEYGKSASPARTPEVRTLREEIRKYASAGRASQDPNQVETRINGWWEQVAAWTTPAKGR